MEFFCYLRIVSYRIVSYTNLLNNYTTQLRTVSAYFRAKLRSETYLGWSFIRNFGCSNRKLGSDRSGSDWSDSDWPGSDRSGSDRSGSDRSGSDRPGSNRSGSDWPGLDRSGIQGQIDQIRIDQIRIDQGRIDQIWIDQGRIDRGRSDRSIWSRDCRMPMLMMPPQDLPYIVRTSKCWIAMTWITWKSSIFFSNVLRTRCIVPEIFK